MDDDGRAAIGTVSSPTDPKIARDSSVKPQGYELSIADGSIEIRHRDELGLRYALDTLDQLRTHNRDNLPDLSISRLAGHT